MHLQRQKATRTERQGRERERVLTGKRFPTAFQASTPGGTRTPALGSYRPSATSWRRTDEPATSSPYWLSSIVASPLITNRTCPMTRTSTWKSRYPLSSPCWRGWCTSPRSHFNADDDALIHWPRDRGRDTRGYFANHSCFFLMFEELLQVLYRGISSPVGSLKRFALRELRGPPNPVARLNIYAQKYCFAFERQNYSIKVIVLFIF